MNLSLRSLLAVLQIAGCLFCSAFHSHAQEKPSENSAEKSKSPAFDAEKLIGKWKHVSKSEGMTISGRTELKKDGTMTANGKITIDGKSTKVALEGTWKLNGDILEETVTKSNQPDLVPVGTVTKDKVLKVTDTEFTYEDEEGEEITETRIEEKTDETKSV